MEILLVFVLFILATVDSMTIPPLFGPYETPVPVPFHGDVEHDGFAWANIYPIMPGFEIWTYPTQETPPSEEQITMLQFNLRARFRHISRDAEHSLYDENQGFCTMELGTHAGSHCYVSGKTDPLIAYIDSEFEHGLVTFTYPTHGCAWTVLESIPPTAWFEDKGFGTYGIRYTATREQFSKTYQGGEWAQGGYGCHHEGLCFPQIVFFRRGYRLVISTWKIPTARREFCEWDGGNETPETITRYELCVDRAHDQYDQGGAFQKYVCAVPCWNDGNIDWEQPHHLGPWDEFTHDPQWNDTAAMWTWTEGVDTCG